jgi:electron transport complex protein RnfC
MKIYSFPRGGLAFDDHTVPPRDSSVVAYLPVFSVIPLVQYPGGRVTTLVSVGDFVKEGMLIGRGGNPGSANVHATVPGRVVRNVEWKDNDGRHNEALVIRMEGAFDRLGKNQVYFSNDGMNYQELQRVLSDCGIVEMEGTGRPVAEILAAFRNIEGPQTLVVRCVFDDPWLAADYVVCRERLQAVVEGSFIIARVGGDKIKRVVFAVSQREKEIGKAMLAEAARYTIPSSMVLTGSMYPQRNRRELELALRNYDKKENLDLGTFLTLGPATLAAVHDAVKYHRPILDRYVAVGGSAVRDPHVMRVRIGMRLGDLFDECKGFIDFPRRIVIGSPLSGKTVLNLDEPVTKTSYAVFAMLKNQTGDHVERDCISCGECRSVCPVGLDPEELYKQIKVLHPGQNPGIGECHGCGCCELVCPSHLPLSSVIMRKPPEGLNG